MDWNRKNRTRKKICPNIPMPFWSGTSSECIMNLPYYYNIETLLSESKSVDCGTDSGIMGVARGEFGLETATLTRLEFLEIFSERAFSPL